MTIRSDTAANMAITIMCLVVTYAVADRFILSKTGAAESEVTSGYRAGESLTTSLDDLPLGRARLSAVVVLSNTCSFCIESAGFYRRLAALEAKANGRFQTLFLGMRGIEDANAFVSRHQLDPKQARPTPPDVQVKVPGTPTLLLVDAEGRVTRSWVGKLTASQETEVINAVSAVVPAN